MFRHRNDISYFDNLKLRISLLKNTGFLKAVLVFFFLWNYITYIIKLSYQDSFYYLPYKHNPSEPISLKKNTAHCTILPDYFSN